MLSTDALVEGFHFLRGSPPRDVGRAATSVSLSDAGAKGARPVGILLDLLVPPTTSERWLRSVVRGAEAAASRFGAHVVGGDTKPSAVATVVSTVIAWGRADRLAPRSGARPGDLLVVTGSVGRGGLVWHRSTTGRPGQRDITLRGFLDVTPRVREGAHLARFAHAMLDTSDGLADAARLMAEASRVRVVLDERRIPWAQGLPATASPRDREAIAFFGGDYELFAAIPPKDLARARRAPGVHVTLIGRVARGNGAFVVTERGVRPLPAAGWQPFGSRSAPAKVRMSRMPDGKVK